MDILDYLRALRRRWRVIAAVALVAAAAAFFTTPAATTANQVPVGTVYQATATLLRSPDVQAVDLPTVRLYISTGEIPRRVAKQVGYQGAPAGLAQEVTVAGDDTVGSVTITSTNPDGARAETIANAFADQTVKYLVELAEKNNQSALDSVDTQVASIVKQLGIINKDSARALDGSIQASVLTSQRQAAEQSLTNLYQRRIQLQAAGAASSPLNVLDQAQAFPQVSTTPSIQAPQTRRPRVLLGLLVGLLVGAAVALLAERLDTRLQGRHAAEEAFGLPVVAEIPHLSRALRRAGPVVSVAAPESAAAEAYRGLRAALLLMPSRALRGDRPSERMGAGSVVLVTAPSARSGKTSTAANLAACLAESGRRVLVIDADFRNPALGALLGVDSEVGLSDLALLGDAGRLEKIVRPSTVAPVSVITAGRRTSGGGVLEANVGGILAQARELADVVIIDGAPILAGSDALDVMPHVDTVVMVGRVRRTTQDQAVRTRELLARIGVPVLGVALIGSKRATVAPSGTSGLRDRVLRVPSGRGAHSDRTRSGRRS